MKTISNTEYVRKGYGKCPICKADSLTFGDLTVDGEHVTQTVVCNDCGTTWDDVFNLIGIADVWTSEGENVEVDED